MNYCSSWVCGSFQIKTARSTTETGNGRQSGSDKANDQARLGGILATFGQASQPMDDPAMPKHFYQENGDSTDWCHIWWIVEIWSLPAYTAKD